MAGPLQMMIGPATVKLLKNVVELLSQPVREKMPEDELMRIEELVDCINVTYSLLERCN